MIATFLWGVLVGMLAEMFMSARDRAKKVDAARQSYSSLSNPRSVMTNEDR